ncbi:hypothetical protein BCR39DRAFT_517536 [Naematelia encephala]|uniref:Phytanoyl-CoA dioxygenase n=1 Tax=Naematelia encephala TaxID=71784 RepID=A0A1Y2BHN8_9TREE|nr:hypothetical protein BCR39DRAFT_517536 [Naematelia encephala]
MLEYKHLTPEERAHFVEHGWLRVPGAIKPKFVEEWMSNLWVRLGWDEHDKSTWTEEYLKMPRHREVPAAELCPEAWAKMCEIVGGEDRIDPVRERYHGDQFICNFGKEVQEEKHPSEFTGWHTDNDWYRQFLDSSGNALTIIHCFTDIPPRGGGTALCEDGIKPLCETFYQHPEGLDPPFEKSLYAHCKSSKNFAFIEAKAGDVFITHGLLPHAHSPNYLHYARVIANPHVNLTEPFNLNRPDGDYSLCEQVILRALGRESIPEYKPTRERLAFYPRTAFFKREKVTPELQRMLADAERKGLPPSSVDSVYLKGEKAIEEHERRNGYDKAFGPNGVAQTMKDDAPYVPEAPKHDVLHDKLPAVKVAVAEI